MARNLSAAGEVNCSIIHCHVLVYEQSFTAVELIRAVAKDCNLIQPKSQTGNILGILQNTNFTDSDICAVFLCEEVDEHGLTGFEIAQIIHKERSNVPIFMRLENGRSENDLTHEQRNVIVGCYTELESEKLRNHTDKFLYGFYFPNPLVDIFIRSGLDVLSSTFKGCEIRTSKPFLVYDHIITTEYTSILPAHFGFGNGILTFLMKESDAHELIAHGHTALKIQQTDNDYVNQLVSEVMNQYWGQVRILCNQLFGEFEDKKNIYLPMVVNHKKNYINFGNHIPQLCFRYVLLRGGSIPEPFIVEFKIMFNTVFKKEDFPAPREIQPDSDADTGFEFF